MAERSIDTWNFVSAGVTKRGSVPVIEFPCNASRKKIYLKAESVSTKWDLK